VLMHLVKPQDKL